MGPIKLFAVASNEGAYLADWIHHHLYFGFDEIEIALNRTTDNSEKILNKINSNNKSIKIKFIDDLVVHSINNGMHFQIEAYRECLISARKDFEFVMFLDLDEYWVPADFSTKIKEYVSYLPKFDTASFLWHINFPEEKEPFDFLFPRLIKVYKDRHVKSLITTQKTPLELTAHNATFENGVALLANYGYLDGNHEDAHFNSKISPEQYEKIKTLQESAYIYHRIFRSQIEYLASLLRNSPTYVSHEIFKKNRNGYYVPKETPCIKKHISLSFHEQYVRSLNAFIAHNSLLEDILQDQEFIRSQAVKVASMVSENPELLKRYEKQFYRCEDIIRTLHSQEVSPVTPDSRG